MQAVQQTAGALAAAAALSFCAETFRFGLAAPSGTLRLRLHPGRRAA